MAIIISVVALSVLILIHELGHFLAAKRAGIWVEEFGIGLPPRIFGKKIGDTLYSVNLLPLGGFVRLHGETNGSTVTDPLRAFSRKPFLSKVLVILAGVVMNFVFGVVCFSLVYSFLGIPRTTKDVSVVEVSPGSPAQVAGILVGDIVRKVGETEVTTTQGFIQKIEEEKGKRIEIEIEREVDGAPQVRKFSVTPRVDPPQGEGPMGVAISTTQIYFPPIWTRPFVGAWYGLTQAVELGGAIIRGLGPLAGQAVKGKIPEGVVGPVGIFALFVFFLREGALPLVNFLGLVSVNLAILNLVPFPPLDGSRIVTLTAEKLVGKKLVPRIESAMHAVGMAILLFLLLMVSVREVPKIVSSGSITNFVQGLVK